MAYSGSVPGYQPEQNPSIALAERVRAIAGGITRYRSLNTLYPIEDTFMNPFVRQMNMISQIGELRAFVEGDGGSAIPPRVYAPAFAEQEFPGAFRPTLEAWKQAAQVKMVADIRALVDDHFGRQDHEQFPTHDIYQGVEIRFTMAEATSPVAVPYRDDAEAAFIREQFAGQVTEHRVIRNNGAWIPEFTALGQQIVEKRSRRQ